MIRYLFTKFSPKVLGFIEDVVVQAAILRAFNNKSYFIESGHPEVRKFEDAVARRLQAPSIVAANSGTDALILALKLFNVGPGDEVIVPAFSFISTASAVSWVNAKPIFADITLDDYAIDPEEILKKINPKTKAIIVAHLYGQPATRLAKIAEIAKKKNIYLIEDTAQSFGAQSKIGHEWRLVGTIGDAGILSFSSTKPLAAPGNAGALILRDRALVEEAKRIRLYGAQTHYFKYPSIGVNSSLHEIQAAALLAKLRFFDHRLEYRRELAAIYQNSLAAFHDMILPIKFPDTKRVWYRFVIRSPYRDEFFSELTKQAGKNFLLKPAINYPIPLPFHEAFRNLGNKHGDFPNAEQAASEVLSLPINNTISYQAALNIAKVLNSSKRMR